MRRKARIAPVLLLAGVALAALAPAGAAPAAKSVTVANFSFTPSSLLAAPGAAITWSWAGGTHNVTAWSGAAFASGTKSAGSFSTTYGGGTVKYRCTLHSFFGSPGACDGMCAEIHEDSTPPAAPSIASPAGGASTGATVTFSGSSSVDTSSVQIREGAAVLATIGASGGAWSGPVTFGGSGSHTLAAVALDAQGNESAASSAVTIDVDATAPSGAVTSPSSGSINVTGTGALVVTGTASDASLVPTVSLRARNGATGATQTFPATCTAGCGTAAIEWRADADLLPGIYELTGLLTDGRGNAGATPTVSAAVISV